MRAVGPSLIVLALVFSAGGVAYRAQAGPQGENRVATAESEDTHHAQQCEVDQTASSQPFVVDLSKLPARADDVVMPLSRTGYNYRDPGLWHPQQEAPRRQPDPAPSAPDQD